MLPLRLALLALTVALPRNPRDGRDVLRAMHDKYAATWYHTLRFVQATTEPDGKVATWYEGLELPGKLRIDIAPLDSGRAILFRADSLYDIAAGKVGVVRPFVHPLMVLGFDVYTQPVETTAAKLDSLGFDLTPVHEDVWQGKPVYVVGAAAGDTSSSQFWVDQQSLLFVRLIQHRRNGALSEARFNDYREVDGGWVAAEVLFFMNGKPAGKEEYSEIKAGVTFPDAYFDPARFAPPTWVASPK